MDSYNTIDSCAKFKLKPTKVGRIALEWKVKQLNSRSSRLDNFFMGAKKFDKTWVRTKDLPIPHQMNYPDDCPAIFWDAAINFILATIFTSEKEQKKFLKNEEVLRFIKITL